MIGTRRARRHDRVPEADVDLSARVGSVALANPVMTASGTSGHADELDAYFPLRELGAVVVKSLSADPWPGNPAPRLHPTAAGMVNSVGLQGPGIAAWLADDLPRLRATGATVVVSVWGRRVEDFRRVATELAGAEGIAAVEINASCPNVEDRRRMFAHSPAATAEVVAAVGEGCPSLARWAKLSPTAADLAEIASAAASAGAEAVTLVNTLLAMVIDVERRAPVLGSGAGGGGLSGPALHPVAVRAVHDVRTALPGLGIVGVGGITRGVDAVELLMAGADAVQVGTATFRDPRAPRRVLREVASWCATHGVRRVADLVGAARG